MKIGFVITHPTQFDVPIFRLGKDIIEVIYVDRDRVNRIFDPELGRNVVWESDNLEGYNYCVIPKNNGLFWIFNKVRNSDYDLLITNGYFNFYYLIALISGRLFAKNNSLRIDTVGYNNKTITRILFKKILYFGLNIIIDHFFVVGSLSKKFLLKNGIPEKKISFLGYVSDNDFFSKGACLSFEENTTLRRKLGISENKKIILCISKHSKREAPIDTLYAFMNINNENLHLLLVGDGPLHGELKSIAAKNMNNNITFTGYVNFQELPAYYGISSVFVHDSHDEPWGVSVQEAVACNIPVVVSENVGAAYDLVRDGLNGFTFKTGNQIELADCILQSLSLNQEIMFETNLNLLSFWNFKSTYNNILFTAK